jgi:thiol-disulfide isomerase/thioredoxin
MSLFARTSAEVELAKTVATELAESLAPIAKRKDSLSSLLSTLSSINSAVNKFVANADAGEADPNKRLYGAGMVSKIRSLKVTVDELNEHVGPLEAKINSEWDTFEAVRLAAEAKRKENEAMQRELEHQRIVAEAKERGQMMEAERKEQARKAEEERLAAEKAALRRAEREREEAANALAKKQEDEEAARRKQQVEANVAGLAKAEEERRAREATASHMSLTIKTSKGSILAVDNITPEATVLGLKKYIETAHHISVASQRLIFQGRLLDDEKKLSDYNISQGIVIHLVENSRAGPSSAGSPALPKLRVPPGTLCHLANGKPEFDEILSSCGGERLAVFDFSAPWCGPCRMIAPVYERLAGRFADVTFVKVDTEQTPANGQLAQDLAITAFPTFQYYVAGQKVHEFSGANASQIEAGIRRVKPVVSTARTSTGAQGSGATSSAETLAGRVMAALNALKPNCSNDDFVVAVRTLLVFVRNITDHPSDAKYRRVRTGNSAYQSRIARHGSRGVACMRAFGFEERNEDGDAYLVISESAANNPELDLVRQQLESAMQAAGVQPDGPSGAAPATAAADMNMARAAGEMTGNPWAGGMPGGPPGMPQMDPALLQELMADPSLQQMAQEFATNPEFSSLTMRLHAAMQSGDHSALMQVAADPALARLQQMMMNNPRLFQLMTQQMGGGGNGAHGLAQMMGAMGGAGGLDTMGGRAGVGRGFATPTQPIRTTAVPPDAPRHGPAPDPPLPANVPFPGAPTTVEEEERLLQEAIRLSMEESSRQSSQKKAEDGPPKDDGTSGGSS